MKNSKMLLFKAIPYEVRNLKYSFMSISEVEKLLMEAFSESWVSKSEIFRVYIDNKYSPQNIIVEMYKGVKSEKNIVELDWDIYKDENGNSLKIYLNYIETNMLPKTNIIKQACLDLDCSQDELAEYIGVKTQSIRNMISRNVFSKQVIRSIELLRENYDLKRELSICHNFKKSLKQFLKEK